MLSLTHTPACPWILWGLMSSVLLSFLATNMKKYYANITTKKTRCGVTSLSVFIMKIFSTTQIIMAFATGPRVIGHFCHHALLTHSLSSQCIIQKILCIIKMQKMWVIVTFYVFKHKNNFQITQNCHCEQIGEALFSPWTYLLHGNSMQQSSSGTKWFDLSHNN